MKDWNWRLIASGLVGIVVLWPAAAALPVLLVRIFGSGSEISSYGSAGDIFGASSALFSGLGFFGVALVLYSDLKERRRDLTHRIEDLAERKRSRTPFIVPTIMEKGVHVARAVKADDRIVETSLTLALMVQNVTDEPAMNIKLTSISSVVDMPPAIPEIDDTPFGTGEAAARKADLRYIASGSPAYHLLQQLSKDAVIRITIGLEYESVNGTRWKSQVSYDLRSSASDRTLFQRILDNDKEAFIEQRPGFGSGDQPFLEFNVVPNSWSHEPLL